MMQDLVKEVAKETGTTHKKTKEIIHLLFHKIKEEVNEKGSFNIVGFGTWTKKHWEESKGVLHGKEFTRPAQNVIRFRASKFFKKVVN